MDIILYSAKGSNSSERVEWALNFKRIAYQRIGVTSAELSTTYREINPYGYVPSLSVDGTVFSESMAILEYLEERFPSSSLLGQDLNEKTAIRRVCEYVNSSIHAPQNRTVLGFLRPELDEVSKRELRGAWILRCLDILRPTICLQSNYAIGQAFSLADIFVASIYKKAIQHVAASQPFYEQHLTHIRQNQRVLEAEPNT